MKPKETTWKSMKVHLAEVVHMRDTHKCILVSFWKQLCNHIGTTIYYLFRTRVHIKPQRPHTPYSIYLYIPNRNLNLKTQNWWRMGMEDDSHCTTFDQRRVITVNHRAGKLVQLLNYCSGSSSLNHVVISFCNIVLLLKAGHNTPQQMHQYLIKNWVVIN